MRVGMDIGFQNLAIVVIHDDGAIEEFPVLRVNSKPALRSKEALEMVQAKYPEVKQVHLGLTGNGAKAIKGSLGLSEALERTAYAATCNAYFRDVGSVINLGHHSQAYVLLEKDPVTGNITAERSSMGTKCGTGSGSFLEDIGEERLGFESLEAFIEAALACEQPAQLGARCAVFAQSDVVGAKNRGKDPQAIAAGLHKITARRLRTSIIGQLELREKVAFVGGLSMNAAMVRFIEEELGTKIFVPKYNRAFGAIGAALKSQKEISLSEAIEKIGEELEKPFDYPHGKPIRLLPGTVLPIPFEEAVYPTIIDMTLPKEVDRVALCVDIGSISTKVGAVRKVDGKLHLCGYYYRRTDGDPLSAAQDAVLHVLDQFEDQGLKIREIAIATTGSGREVTGDLFDAQLIKNEITCQASGTIFFFPDDEEDTVLEVGGEDGKMYKLKRKKRAVGDKDNETDSLKRHKLVRFRMNDVCAAGTGAFIERTARGQGMAIGDFGDFALLNEKPPILEDACTLLAAAHMANLAANNARPEDLAAGILWACARNFLAKTLKDEPIVGDVVFQGAPAYIKGFVAAFEAELGRVIKVPPLPHLTGAIGGARLALLDDTIAAIPFEGYRERIQNTTYKRDEFVCKTVGCDNRCTVMTYKRDDGKTFFFGDRCGKFSDVGKDTHENIPDFFLEREKMLMEACGTPGDGKKGEIAVPRGYTFADYAPLYFEFLRCLGYKPVASPPTNKEIVDIGTERAYSELCFPAKVSQAHAWYMIGKGYSKMFCPTVHETEQENSQTSSHTCPYLQTDISGIPAEQIVSPRLHFNRPDSDLEVEFVKAGRQLGCSDGQSKKAFRSGMRALRNFRQRLDAYGAKVLSEIPKGQKIFVVLGRPYTMWDPLMNLNIVKMIRDLGIVPLPMDLLPLSEVDISDVWTNAYARQVAKKLAAGRIIRENEDMYALVISYYACGPDAFGDRFLAEEIGPDKGYEMQFDEHTTSANTKTRIEALDDATEGEKAATTKNELLRTEASPIQKALGRIIYVPYVSKAAEVFAENLTVWGYESAPLPISSDPTLGEARKCVPPGVCVPTLYTTEDMIQLIRSEGFDRDRAAIFQGRSEGPCRFGMYSQLQRIVLDSLGYSDIPIVSLGRGNEEAGLGLAFPLGLLDSLMVHDLLEKMLLHIRPYEKSAGEADKVFSHYVRKLVGMIPLQKYKMDTAGISILIQTEYLGDYVALLQRAEADFLRIPMRDESRPVIGLAGEFYVRLHERANNYLIRTLEEMGHEVWLAPMTEFFTYISSVCGLLARERRDRHLFGKEEWKEVIKHGLNNWVIDRHEKILAHALTRILVGRKDVSAAEIIERGSRWVSPHFGGESMCSMGKGEDFVSHPEVCGIVSVGPFNCMPSIIVAALSSAFSDAHGNIPFASLSYGAMEDPHRDAQIVEFSDRVHVRHQRRNR